MPKKKLKVLMIGNSFSESVLAYLPQMVKADDKHPALRLRQAYIGGCSIERHLQEYDQALADPSYRPYLTNMPLPGAPRHSPKRWEANVPEMLKENAWDIVSIQQASRFSWRQETYGKDAERLISIIRELAPTAEIVVHETWAYRKDAPSLSEWNLTQHEMHKRLAVAYRELASSYGFRLIPVGDAIELSRKAVDIPYAPLPEAARKKLRWPDLPPNAGDLVGRDFWYKNPETGEMELRTDACHLNPRGSYLQACVWYMFLFGRKASDLRFFPKDFDDAFCKKMASIAEKALTQR
ncbi:MAG: DUF4886 domain-containing protein [Victivallales bacterium]|nr:DUF4886 domain-containing protein [Victivallales bacterium]